MTKPPITKPSSDSVIAVAIAPETQQLITLWLHGKSRHTRRYYRRDAERFLQFADAPLNELDAMDVQRFFDHLEGERLAPSSLGRTIAAIKSFLKFAHQMGANPNNIGSAFKVPSSKDTLSERILTREEVLALIDHASSDRNRVMLRMLYSCGLRVSELCGLQWRDLRSRQDGGQVTIYGKGNKTRVVLIPASVWQDLHTLKEKRPTPPTRTTPVFPSQKGGGALDPSQIMRIVRQAARKAGLEANISPHWLRHAHASHSLDRGAPIHLVQNTLGHSSVATTGRYLHARPQDSSSKYLDL
ncbi:MAG: tyrosine-type recombinase/integrase [Cyanobacteria bacterium P01_C01_bin.89]